MKQIFNKTTSFKSIAVLIFTAVLLTSLKPTTVNAQSFDTGVDFYSTYIFRGVAFSGPSIQPYVEFSTGGFSIGAWGSQGIDGLASEGSLGFQEMDLYAAYEFDFGLSIGLTDYYYPGTDYFDSGSHAIELNLGFELDNFSLSGNYMFNEAEGAGSAGSDLYFEAGLSFGSVNIFAGAGDGWHSMDGDFALVNVGLATTKEIKVTESFSIPLTGAAILNPDTEQFYIVVGISF